MPDERTSPSSGWQEVYGTMGTDTSVDAPANLCPDCSSESKCSFQRVFECEDHGVWALDETPRTGTDSTKADSFESCLIE